MLRRNNGSPNTSFGNQMHWPDYMVQQCRHPYMSTGWLPETIHCTNAWIADPPKVIQFLFPTYFSWLTFSSKKQTSERMDYHRFALVHDSRAFTYRYWTENMRALFLFVHNIIPRIFCSPRTQYNTSCRLTSQWDEYRLPELLWQCHSWPRQVPPSLKMEKKLPKIKVIQETKHSPPTLHSISLVGWCCLCGLLWNNHTW